MGVSGMSGAVNDDESISTIHMARDVRVTPTEIAELESAVRASSVAGSRYAEAQMEHLDSER